MSNYFDNEVVQGWTEEYLEIHHFINDKKQEAIQRAEKKEIEFCEQEFMDDEIPFELKWKQEELKEKIFKEIGKIINGIIFTHKFTAWDNYDDLYQEAAEACIKALPKFNPNFITSNGTRATLFNYISLTAKRCLKFYTIKGKKHRDNLQIEDYAFNLQYDDSNHISQKMVHDEFIIVTKKIYSNSKYKKFLPLVEILHKYFVKIGDFSKRDFFRFAKSYGWSPNLIRKFLKIMMEHQEQIYEGISLIYSPEEQDNLVTQSGSED